MHRKNQFFAFVFTAVIISFFIIINIAETNSTIPALSSEETKIILEEAETFKQILSLYSSEALLKPLNLRLCAYEMLQIKKNGNSCRDKYSAWHSKEDYQELLLPEIEGKFGGVGLKVISKEGKVIIISLINGMPAEQAGVKSGDEIVEVGGKKINSMEDSVKLLRGKIGTKVRIKVRRSGTNDLLTFELVRAEIIISATESKMLRSDIGYIKIKNFSKEMPDEFTKTFEDYRNKRINKIIIDLRDNPGGALNSALEILYDFAKTNDIIILMRQRNKSVFFNTSFVASTTGNIQNPGTFRDMKIAVLINKESASASEIFAGTMKDWGFPIIGSISFGKGVGQTIFPLTDGSALRLTTFEFLVGNSMTKINEIGVIPDYKISDPALLSAAEILREDRQLEKAVEIISH